MRGTAPPAGADRILRKTERVPARKKSICYVYVVFGAACWGFIGLFNRMLGDVGVSVGTRVTVRNLFALALLTVIFGLFHRQVFHIQARHLPIFLGAGILSVLGMAVAYFQCQMLCSLAVAGVLLYLAPSFVVLMSAALWRAPITKRKLAALALALLGCAFVSGIAGGGLTVSLGGILLGVAAGFCYATYTIFAHYGLQHYDSYTMTYWTFMFAGIGSLFFLKLAELPLVFASSRGVLGMLGLVVVSTVLPYIFYTKGLEGVESGKASIIANVEPVVGALLGVLVFRETLDAWTVLGIVCVLGGVILLAGGEKAVEQAAAAQ